MFLNEEVTALLKNDVVDYIGYADLEKYENDLIQFGGSIVKGYKTGISIGIVLADSIVDYLPDRNNPDVSCEYKCHCYNIINDRLNIIASKLSSYLNQKGFRTLPIVAAETTNNKEVTPTVSHKMIAHIAGLGWIGKSCLLVTPEHGPRVKFVTVLTNAPLKGNDTPLEQQCHGCLECMKICPAQAITGVNYETGKSREDSFDYRKCQQHFKTLKETTKWDVCGMCLYICPHGRGHKN